MKKVCNMCGKKIDRRELLSNPFEIHNEFGHGSKYDTDTLDLRLCSNCQDELITYLIEKCKLNPITEIY